jgi:hypothetical protein
MTPRRTARTTVGAAVLADGTSIILALAALEMQVEDKLTSLREARSNSDEKHQEIADYGDLKQRVEAILDATVRFFAGAPVRRARGGLGLPIIGRLLGHTQAATTARYAHLDNDPLRSASEAIGGRIAAALDGKRGGSVVQLKGGRRR